MRPSLGRVAGAVLVCLAGALTALTIATPLSSGGTNEQVCPDMDGKFESSGSGTGFSVSIGGGTATITVEAGYALVAYCVKAGSANQGNGPEIHATNVVGPGSITVSHSSGKDVSHVSVDVEPSGTTTTETTPTTTETTPTETTPTTTETTPTTTETTPTTTETTPTTTETTPTDTTPGGGAGGGGSGGGGSGGGDGAGGGSTVAQPQGELPLTGLSVWTLLAVAGGLLAGGLLLLRRGRSEP
jgi:hypothetical protein